MGVNTQSERCHNNTVGYLKTTAVSVYNGLLTEKHYKTSAFCLRSVLNILNRLNYTLKKVRKCLPLKRIAQTDAIFENIAYHRSAKTSGILRISVDVKDKVRIGELSRKGYHRHLEPVKALDKDQCWNETLVPLGILNLNTNKATIVVGNSNETADFIVDGLALWFEAHKSEIVGKYHTLEIYSDNGPQVESSRTQFINRIMEFVCITGIKVHLLYYPPYHSKYNPIERVWSAVEQYWSGTILSTVKYAINTIKNVKWKGVRTTVIENFKTYAKGIKLTPKQMSERQAFLIRKVGLEPWDVLIEPSVEMGGLFIT